MCLLRSLAPLLGLALAVGCADDPPFAPERPLRRAAQLAATSVVDGFTITAIPKPAGWEFMEPRRILDDGTVYGFVDADDASVRFFRWTAAGGTEPVADIPPTLAGRAFDDPPGQFFYDDGTVRNIVGRKCGHVGPADPAFEDPDFCEFDDGVGTYVTSSCFPDAPEPGVHSGGLAVNALCHVLAARSPHSPNFEHAVYLWRPDSDWQRIIDDPLPLHFYDFFGSWPLLNNQDQAVVITQPGGGLVAMVWRPDLGARALPLPPSEAATALGFGITAMNDRGDITGWVEGLTAEEGSSFAVVWTPPPVDRTGDPTIDASPHGKKEGTSIVRSPKRGYKQFYSIAGDPSAGPWEVRIDWGDGATTLATLTRTSKMEKERHQYAAAGTYEVQLTVTDALGRSGSDSHLVEVLR